MRALWLIRPDLQTHPGGDTTQVLRTAEGLRRRGINVDLSHAVPKNAARNYELAHLFHLDRLWENLEHCRRLRDSGLPVVLSTIWWPMDGFDAAGRAGAQGFLSRMLGSERYQSLRLMQRSLLRAAQRPKWPAGPWWSFRKAVQAELEMVRVLLPNSAAELAAIQRRFGPGHSAVIVPNAADGERYFLQPAREGRAIDVLCVGRIEPRKNQLALIRAARGAAWKLAIVGQAGRYARAYDAACRREAGGNVRFISQSSPDELRKLYNAARVHACVSWYETPGLASLEAALCGCALLVTPGGCTREYFESDAEYAEPADPASIRAAIERALARGPSEPLRKRVTSEFNWERAAAKTLEGYRIAHECRPGAAGRS